MLQTLLKEDGKKTNADLVSRHMEFHWLDIDH